MKPYRLTKEKTDGKIELSKIRFLLYGPPKIGKSTQASGFPNALFLITDKKDPSLQIYKESVKDWETFLRIKQALLNERHRFKTIVFDVIDLLFLYCNNFICSKLGIDHISEGQWGKGYDMLVKEFESEMSDLFLSDLGLIFISHTTTVELTSRNMTISKIVPTLQKRARAIITPKVSLIGYMDYRTIKNKHDKSVTKRVISFSPDELVEAGDNDGKLPPEIVTSKDPKETYEIFKQAYK